MPEETPNQPTHEQLKQAFKAFKKRLKFARLADESQFTRNPMSGGRPSSIVAIAPPDQFPDEVWLELVRLGKLKKAGHGMYELAPE